MSCVIIGAGKIARGFIGHLLYLNKIDFTFIEYQDSLADLINERKQYTVNILGNSEKNCVVKNVKAIRYSDTEKAAGAIAEAKCVFTAVGGKNLENVARLLTLGIEMKAPTGKPLNIVTCENWKQPAKILHDYVRTQISEESRDYFETQVGITEAVIMRSGIESDEELRKMDPLIVNVQDFWELPIDASRVVGSLPAVKEIKLVSEFSGFLERKFYTYNAANGSVSFLGALLGYDILADAAHDERILEILDGVYLETAQALSKKHQFPLEEQLAFTLTSKKKLQDYTIVDFIERNARDPLRKLGKDDRLVGSARMVMDYGILPENLATAIAAAIYYENESDEFAVELKRLRTEEGIDAILTKVCQIDADGVLGTLVKVKIALLKERGWIHE